MSVQLAADVAELEQVGRRRRRVELAQLRRRELANGHIRVGRDPLRRADRADEVSFPALGRCPDDLDRVAIRGDADDASVVALQHGDELRQRLGLR